MSLPVGKGYADNLAAVLLLAKKNETATQAKLQARACLREYVPMPQGVRLSRFFGQGTSLDGNCVFVGRNHDWAVVT